MKSIHQYWVYIVECKDGKYYTGITGNLQQRIAQHNSGYFPTCFTFNRRPVTLRYFQHFTEVKNAIAWEKQLKGWSRKKKEALINGDFREIQRLARSGKK